MTKAHKRHYGKQKTMCWAKLDPSPFFLFRMGDLDPWMDELYLHKLWSQKGEQVVIKLIRDKRSG